MKQQRAEARVSAQETARDIFVGSIKTETTTPNERRTRCTCHTRVRAEEAITLTLLLLLSSLQIVIYHHGLLTRNEI